MFEPEVMNKVCLNALPVTRFILKLDLATDDVEFFETPFYVLEGSFESVLSVRCALALELTITLNDKNEGHF